MQVIYTTEPVVAGLSLFLAGPSPRKLEDGTWRVEAMGILEQLGFDGIVYNPEQRNGVGSLDFAKTGYPADWEKKAILASTVLLFWVPRSAALPGFTTNVEFGRFIQLPRLVYGRPDGAPHTRYLDWLWRDEGKVLPIYNNLRECLKAGVELARN